MTNRLFLALVSGSIILTLSVGLRQVFGLFLIPVTEDLSVARETFGLIIGLQNLVWGLSQPIAGYVADRFGALRVAFVGGVLYASGLGLAALSTSAEHLGLTTGVLVGLAQSGTAYAVVLGAIGRAAPPEKRSMALGIASTAGSIGMFTLVPLTQGIIEIADWRLAFAALTGLAIAMPFLALGLRETTVSSAQETTGHPEEISVRQALAVATRHPSFWMLNAGFAACGFQLAFLSTHLPSVLLDGGLSAATGAAALALIGLSNIVGTYCCGLLGGWYPKNKVLTGLYLVRTALFVLFLSLPMSLSSVMLFAVTIGLTWTGTVPLTSGLVGDIFGTRHMGLLFGIVYVGHQLGAFIGAWAGGMSFDRTGSYALVWLGAIVLGCLAAALHWPISLKSAFPVPSTRAAS
jgi:predicted MFS family arabinose efflux permease